MGIGKEESSFCSFSFIPEEQIVALDSKRCYMEQVSFLVFVAVFSLKRSEQNAQLKKRRIRESWCDSSIPLSGPYCQTEKLWLLLAEAWERFESI